MDPYLGIQTFYPQHPLLKKYVAYYYFLKTDPSFETQYLSFPNTYQALNIHKHAQYVIQDNQIKVIGSASFNPLMILQGKYQRPIYVHLTGCLDKVTILFKPLGLNHFIQKPFGEIAQRCIQEFTLWEKKEEISQGLQLFFQQSNEEQKLDALENYLCKQFISFEYQEILATAIDKLSDMDNELMIDEIAKMIHLSCRTFNRLFQKHLGISPMGFKNICRFRNSLKKAIDIEGDLSLTKLAHQNNFYDSSYLNRVYKKMAGDRPSKFFPDIHAYCDNQTVFRFSPL